MTRTITLRLPQEIYELFQRWAKLDHRPISNLIETAALRQLEEHALVSQDEMEAILANQPLIHKLKRGSEAARKRKGRLIG